MKVSLSKYYTAAHGWGSNWLRSLPRWAYHFLAGVLLTVAIDMFLEFSIHGLRLHRAIETAVLDWSIRMHEGVSPRSDRPLLPFTLIDIDENTYQRWGEPILVPRDKIAALLQRTVRAQAWLAVVDVDLSRRTSSSQDQALVAFLKQHAGQLNIGPPSTPQLQNERSTQIMLLRTFRPSLDADGGLEARASIADPVLASRPRNIHQAMPLFEFDRDLAVRRWRLWQPACGSAFGDVLPSVQLLTVLLHRIQHHEYPREHLDLALREVATGICRVRVSDLSTAAPQQSILAGLELDLDTNSTSSRINYRFSARHARSGSNTTVVIRGRSVPLIIYISARKLLEGPDDYDDAVFRDRIVVIGGSYADAKDLYNTPLGPMPGALILVNSIHSLLHYGQLRTPPAMQRAALYVSLLTLPNLLLAVWRSRRGAYILHAGLGIIFLATSLWLLQSGLWFDSALPLISVFLAYSVEQLRKSTRKTRAHEENAQCC